MPPYLGPQPLHLIPPKLMLLKRDLAAPQSRSVTPGSCLTPGAPRQGRSTPQKGPSLGCSCAEGKQGRLCPDGDSCSVAVATALVTITRGTAPRPAMGSPRSGRSPALGLSGCVTPGSLSHNPGHSPCQAPLAPGTLPALGTGNGSAAPLLPLLRVQVGNQKPNARRAVLSPCQEPRTEISLISPRCE